MRTFACAQRRRRGEGRRLRYGFVIDQRSCIGCHACTVACKTEHGVALGVNRTWVRYVEKGRWPDTRRYFSVLRCNHCTDPPCVRICPTAALYVRGDGIVDFDTSRCIGCKSCMQACPYDALYIDPDEHTAQKCNYCSHRVDVGLEPACVVVCPERAIVAGDLDDPTSRIARLVATEQTTVRAPEQGTGPNVFYLGVESANVEPLRAEPLVDGGMWRDPPGLESWLAVDLAEPASAGRPVADGGAVGSRPGSPRRIARGRGGAPARVVYDTDHPMPWGWRVSSYFLAKGIAAGIALAAAVALLFGAGVDSTWMSWAAPLVSGAFLASTGVLLVWDLKRPDRFHYLLTRGNPSSWLVRGAWILTAFAVVDVLWFLAGVTGRWSLVPVLIWVCAVLALAVAGYTAFLFGQAEGRDLWQSPTLPWHMIAAALTLGGGVSLIAALFSDVGAPLGSVAPSTSTPHGALGVAAFAWTMMVGTAALGSLAAGEMTSRHPTAGIAAAVHHLTEGRYAGEYRLGLVLGVLVPLLAAGAVLAGAVTVLGAIGGVAASIGIWLADDAFVRAGQSVPLS